MATPAITPEEAQEMMQLIRTEAPDLHDFIKELYNQGMIDGARNIEYVKINGREFGHYSGPGAVLHPAPRLKE